MREEKRPSEEQDPTMMDLAATSESSLFRRWENHRPSPGTASVRSGKMGKNTAGRRGDVFVVLAGSLCKTSEGRAEVVDLSVGT